MEAKDNVPAQDSYYPYQAQLPGGNYGPPPVYGPPPEIPVLPTGDVEIEFAFDELILRCIVEEPLEVRKKYHSCLLTTWRSYEVRCFIVYTYVKYTVRD